MTITLYSLCGADETRPFSPHCWKVVMALHHKGLPFVESPKAFTAIPGVENGASKTVPLLRDGETLISDSFAIARYLEETYPDRPSLFGGEGGLAMARFVEAFSNTTVHPAVTRIAIVDICNMLGPEDQSYFRESRSKRLGKQIEEVAAGRDTEIAEFADKLKPVRYLLAHQPFIGGENPLFADYIVFGALKWLDIASGSVYLPEEDPVFAWYQRCLDLFAGQPRKVA